MKPPWDTPSAHGDGQQWSRMWRSQSLVRGRGGDTGTAPGGQHGGPRRTKHGATPCPNARLGDGSRGGHVPAHEPSQQHLSCDKAPTLAIRAVGTPHPWEGAGALTAATTHGPRRRQAERENRVPFTPRPHSTEAHQRRCGFGARGTAGGFRPRRWGGSWATPVTLLCLGPARNLSRESCTVSTMPQEGVWRGRRGLMPGRETPRSAVP